MPPGKNSRYKKCLAMQSVDGRWMLTNPKPFRYTDKAEGTMAYTAVAGDTWYSLAERLYGSDGWRRWKQLMDFQPDPPCDPTVAIAPGTTVYCPSQAYMEQVIMQADPERL